MYRPALLACVLCAAACAASRPAPIVAEPGRSLRPWPAVTSAKETASLSIPKELPHDELTQATATLARLDETPGRKADDDAALVLHSLRVALAAQGVRPRAPASIALRHAAAGFESIPSARDRCARVRFALDHALDALAARALTGGEAVRHARRAVAAIDGSLPYELQLGPVRRAFDAVVLAFRASEGR